MKYTRKELEAQIDEIKVKLLAFEARASELSDRVEDAETAAAAAWDNYYEMEEEFRKLDQLRHAMDLLEIE